ncbi:TolC family protein [Prevotella sp. tc2-28]|jgi:NodT family efflux transporter outer membrane factor (OMF) lipoprotein|uniref:TolC family protein n=1 Tax=Prevotella sp. tc2-28 TaxID=1761888 RepID=UPI000B89108F|nr:TolC family protein [Prevotella sp. tc2-28]
MKKLMTMISVVLLVSSCGLYNKYERPDVNTTGLIRDALSDVDTLAVQDTASFGNLPWRSVFTDPQLQQLIEQGLEKNADLLNAALNVQMYETMLRAAKLAFLPAVNLGNAQQQMGYITTVHSDPSSTVKAYTFPATATWTVDLFGNVLSQKRSTQMKLLGMKDYQMAVRAKIISGVANSYYTLLMLDEQLRISEDMGQMAKETWEMMQLQYKLGRVRSTGVQSAEASYLSTMTKVNEFRRQIRSTENALCLLIGQAGQQIPRTTLAQQSLPSEFATGVGAALLKNRPDVHNAEMSLAACFHDVQTARSQFYPSITIGATANFSNLTGSSNPGKWTTTFFGSLLQPIFNRGALTAKLKVTKIQYEQAFNTWQNAILKAGNEVSNALVNYNQYDANSKLEAQRVKVLTQNVEDTKALYKSSSSTYLEVLTAQTQLLTAQLNLASNDFNKMQAVVSLYTALGGGGK